MNHLFLWRPAHRRQALRRERLRIGIRQRGRVDFLVGHPIGATPIMTCFLHGSSILLARLNRNLLIGKSPQNCLRFPGNHRE
ncbi:MAG TPA: hypothetical protein VGX95_17705 [Xanthobacteraceae bacterium]|nr:hypothetical protein [Xanthobacteraceae bacterium]